MRMSNEYKAVIPMREGEELNHQRLSQFLTDHVPEAPEGELEIRQFSAGHSNLTYLLKINDWEAVLRRPPLGPVAPRAHDMEREYTILKNLNPVYPAAPRPYVFSKDESVVGSPFFIMERRTGVFVDTEFPSDIDYTPEIGEKISNLMVEQLVKLHNINYKETGLVNLARPEGFLERQVSGWIERYQRAKTDDVPHIDLVTDYLEKNIPTSPEPTIIHYDYKINNALFSDDFTEMNGLFDWEMTTVGDPLADLAAAMSYWRQADDPKMLIKSGGKPPVTVMEGFYTRDQFIQEYANKSGQNIDSIDYYLVFAHFKLVGILQQIYYRYHRGQTSDKRFARLNEYVAALVDYIANTIKDSN